MSTLWRQSKGLVDFSIFVAAFCNQKVMLSHQMNKFVTLQSRMCDAALKMLIYENVLNQVVYISVHAKKTL